MLSADKNLVIARKYLFLEKDKLCQLIYYAIVKYSLLQMLS
jgi:hypothetical protein